MDGGSNPSKFSITVGLLSAAKIMLREMIRKLFKANKQCSIQNTGVELPHVRIRKELYFCVKSAALKQPAVQHFWAIFLSLDTSDY